MPGRRNPRAKWVLPTIVNPPERLCYKVLVPNERQHIGAFLGAIYALSSAMSWQDDTAHTAKSVALVWQDIFDSLRTENCNEPEVLCAIAEMEYSLSICEQLRWHNGILQGLCCGTWTNIDGQPSPVGGSGQPGGNAPQPQPGGGCVSYHASFNASSQWLLPTVVNAGDTLDFSNMYGSGWDGGVTNTWTCWNGQAFVFGACIGSPLVFGAPDPAPLLPHMAIVAHIGSTWYVCDGPTLTIPGGVSNAPVVIQVNDNVLSDNSGGYSLDIQVCNNGAVNWCYENNFAVNPYGELTPSSPSFGASGKWVAGTGWIQDVFSYGVPTYRNGVVLDWTGPTLPAGTRIDVTFDYTRGIYDAGTDTATGIGSTATSVDFNGVTNGTNKVISGNLTASGGFELFFECDRISGSYSGFVGALTLKKIRISGTSSTSPLPSNNC